MIDVAVTAGTITAEEFGVRVATSGAIAAVIDVAKGVEIVAKTPITVDGVGSSKITIAGSLESVVPDAFGRFAVCRNVPKNPSVPVSRGA